MPSAKKPEITNGQSLDVQPGVSNIGENQATLEALRNANIDGQDVYPTSVSTKRFSAEDGNFNGMVRSGTMLVGSGGVTITSDADGGTPATGIHASASILQLIKSGVAQVTLDGSTGDATFIGAITATSGTFTGTVNATAGYFVGSITIGTDTAVGTAATGTWLTNSRLLMKYAGTTKIDFNTATDTYTFSGGTITAMASVNFGTSITIGGDIVLNTGAVDGKLRFDGAAGNCFIDFDAVYGSYPAWGLVHNSSTGIVGIGQGGSTWSALATAPRIFINSGTIYIENDGTNGGNATTRDININIGTNSGNKLNLSRGGTVVMSFVGNSSDVTFAGNIIAGAGADYVLVGPDATTPMRVSYYSLGVAVTGTGAFATGTWTHGWNTGTSAVYFVATMQDIDTTKSTGISNVRVERTSTTTVKVEFLVATYASTQTIYFDVIAIGQY